MKKIFVTALIALVTLSCSKSEFEPSAQKSATSIRIHSSEVATRAIHGTGTEDGTSFSWEAGVDAINLLWTHTYSSGYKDILGPEYLVNTKNGETACFEADSEIAEDIAVGDTLYAIYPYESSTYFNYYDYSTDKDTPCFRTSFGSTMQVGDNNTDHLDNLDIMISKPVVVTAGMQNSDGSYDIPMEFAHLFSKMRINIVNGTDAPFDVRSIIYHSTNSSDIMSGIIYMDMKTREIMSSVQNYGDCSSSSNAVLQTSGITIPAGGSATLWMWMKPLDFTAGNADGRKANIYLNTSAGTFHVDGVNFDQAFQPGMTYRHKFTATAAKKLDGYTLIPDVNFLLNLYESANYSGISLKFYDFDLKEVETIDPYDESTAAKLAGGLFVKDSEVAGIDTLGITMLNAVSTEGLQAFKGLKSLALMFGVDMSSVITVRSLDISTLTELEELGVDNSQITYLDISKNTKLKTLNLCSHVKSINGLKDHPSIENLYITKVSSGEIKVGDATDAFSADLSGCKKLKKVDIWREIGELNLSSISLDELTLAGKDLGGLKLSGTKVTNLRLEEGPVMPSVPEGVRVLTIYGTTDGTSVGGQLGSFDQIDSLVLEADLNSNIVFGPANSSIRVADVKGYERDDAENNDGTFSGFENLTGVENLTVAISRDASVGASLDFSASKKCRVFGVSITAGLVSQDFNLPDSPYLKEAKITFTKAYPQFTVSGLSALEELTIDCEGSNNGLKYIKLGELPALKKLHVHSISCKAIPLFCANCYPSLSDVSIVGRYIDTFPTFSSEIKSTYSTEAERLKVTHDAFPALSYLSINDCSNVCDSGINTIDLRPFTALTGFSCFFKYYDQDSGSIKERGQESILITQSQADYTATPTEYGGYHFYVCWFYSWYNYGTANVTAARTSSRGYYYGGYGKIMDDVTF